MAYSLPEMIFCATWHLCLTLANSNVGLGDCSHLSQQAYLAHRRRVPRRLRPSLSASRIRRSTIPYRRRRPVAIMSTAETTVSSASRPSIRSKFITSTQSLTTHNCIWDSGRLCEQTMLVKEHIFTCRPTSTIETLRSTQRLVWSTDLPHHRVPRAEEASNDDETAWEQYAYLILGLGIAFFLTILIFVAADRWYKRKVRRALERSAAQVAVHGGQSGSPREAFELDDLAQRPQTNIFAGGEGTREESVSLSRPSSRAIRPGDTRIRGREEDEEHGRAESSAKVSSPRHSAAAMDNAERSSR